MLAILFLVSSEYVFFSDLKSRTRQVFLRRRDISRPSKLDQSFLGVESSQCITVMEAINRKDIHISISRPSVELIDFSRKFFNLI
ncbi:hypothetical protein HA466_0012490 [Hirschfeldia incana]|nr:hypothetical protein HA466_0012490 [Hirschfeldia incana]KAJ0264852.1 hypothetical protein HA466_0012490 [Hirschfeldia incana]